MTQALANAVVTATVRLRFHRRCNLLCFYCATLCVSAVFAVARRLSVRPSVTLVHYIQTAEEIVKLLCRLGSSIILVF